MPRSRGEAIASGMKKYFTGRPCANGHITTRNISNYSCDECQRDLKKSYYKRNRSRILERESKRYKNNKAAHAKRCRNYFNRTREVQLERIKIWREQNKDRVLAAKARYRERNRDKLSAANKRRYLDNPDKAFAHAAASRARRRMAYPQWADRAEIVRIYEMAKYLTSSTGVVHEVDHIYPIAGKTVCGLHVPENLQIVTVSENRRKSNKHPEDLRSHMSTYSTAFGRFFYA
jgi:hypothetical protein